MKERVQLLANVLDALDRLFDGKAGVIDVYAITYATAQALLTDKQFVALSESAKALQVLARAGLPIAQARERALDATNELRSALADDIGLQ